MPCWQLPFHSTYLLIFCFYYLNFLSLILPWLIFFIVQHFTTKTQIIYIFCCPHSRLIQCFLAFSSQNLFFQFPTTSIISLIKLIFHNPKKKRNISFLSLHLLYLPRNIHWFHLHNFCYKVLDRISCRFSNPSLAQKHNFFHPKNLNNYWDYHRYHNKRSYK